MEAKRYNKDKLRYDLISNIALKELAAVYTKGAEKYTVYNDDGSIKEDGANNWKLGLPWKSVIASAKRHIAAWESGEDIDPDLNTKHLANAMWNIATLLHYTETKPEFDDRDLWYKKPLKSLWLDLDGVLFDFEKDYLNWYASKAHCIGCDHTFKDNLLKPPTDWNDYRFREGFSKVKDDQDFWRNMSTLIKPEDISYPISGYCTSRSSCKLITIHESLIKHGFPKAKIINTEGNKTKSQALLELNDPNIVMVDDSFDNFNDLQKNGIVCYLMSRPHNLKYDVGHWRVNNMQELMIKLKTT